MSNDDKVEVQSLRGMHLLIARPRGEDDLMRSAHRAGAKIIHLPTVEMELPEDIEKARLSLSRAQGADVLIFTSPRSVQFTYQIQDDFQPKAAAIIIAVGPGTQKELARNALPKALIPETLFSSEGILQMPCLQDVGNKAVAIMCAPEGRSLLQTELILRNALVVNCHVYQRRAVVWSAQEFDAIEQAPRNSYLLVSSQQALIHIQNQLPALIPRKLFQMKLVVASQRIAETARSLGFSHVTVAESALSQHMISALVQAASRT